MEARINLLNHGYIQLIEVWGSDAGIIESARMSTQKGFQGWGTPEAPGDEKLLKFLSDNKHTTPFEMAGATFEIQAPIFVFREWHRHRTQSYSEASARYAPLPELDYVPTIDRLLRPATSSRQTQGMGRTLDERNALRFQLKLAKWQQEGQQLYQDALDAGVPKELARLANSVGRYSRMRASANLLNWLKFISLRTDIKAQEEIRVYADALAGMLRSHFSRTMALHANARR